MLAVLLLITIATAGNSATAFNLLDPGSLIKSHKIVASVINGTIGQNSSCARDLAVLDQAILRRETWALKSERIFSNFLMLYSLYIIRFFAVLDASSKISPGILDGNIVDLGMFDECMGIEGRSLGVEIRAHHCMYSIASTSSNVTVPLNPSLSICLPSTCNGPEIVNLFNRMIGMVNRFKDLGITVASATCTSVKKEIWDREFIVYFSIVAIYIGLLLLCTVCHAILRLRDAGEHRTTTLLSTLAKFSLIKGASSILSTRAREGNLPAIHGIRCLAMGWIVLGHEYVFHVLGVNVNLLSIVNWMQSWRSLYIFEWVSHDACVFKTNEQRTSLQHTQVLFAQIFEINTRRSGFDDIYGCVCAENHFWTSLRFSVQLICRKLSEKVVDELICLGHLWYLAVDMQLFLVSPIILYPLYKKPKLGLAILFALFSVTLVTPGVIVGINKYPPFSFIHNKSFELIMDVFKEIYEMPYNRASPWLIGTFLGFELTNSNRRLGKLSVWNGWLTAIVAFAFCTFGSRTFVEPSYEYNVIWESFFLAVSRPIWAVGLSWIIYASLNNYAGPISTVLSWKLFQPLSRISYCVYLVHYVVQLTEQSAQRTPNYFSDYFIFHDFLGDLAISIVIGFFLSLLFESPFLVLEKMLFRRKRKSVEVFQENIIPKNSRVEQA
ncbi:hypothetical protein TSAR_009169 [Trichomalopsis sarcophagae]|uniref:Nose resistant-to-fluoxetine protein N-terminal domain-containing protein n=1 Tax=Trichomalopsis sarcophagae TaxID=543379 RepID=A0A232F176_9HYME|nr:hypothetical protein TSAR_009169 [Trichomalopsis sarcophagae]